MPIDHHEDAEPDQRAPKLRAGVPPSREQVLLAQILEELEDREAEGISDSEVRITHISVRSALMRVRWNDMPVRREDSSTEI